MGKKVTWMYQISSGLGFLHENQIIHRDIKSMNVLVGPGLECKITDFGTSRKVDKDKHMTKNQGTVSWMAPEVAFFVPTIPESGTASALGPRWTWPCSGFFVAHTPPLP